MNLSPNASNVVRLLGVLAVLFALAVQLDWIASGVEPIVALIVGVVVLLIAGAL